MWKRGALGLGWLWFVAAGCGGSTIDRWEGEGCQPACVRHYDQGQPRAQCATPDGDTEACRRSDEGLPSCAQGRLSCETEDGLPRCEGASNPDLERPACTSG